MVVSDKMSSYLAQFSPVPSFSEYTGLHKVGTMDVEIPVASLQSPSPAPDDASSHHNNIGTVQFRVFYPAVAESDEKSITWLPNPQRHHISAYTKFVGVQSMVAEFLS
jgi:platelet-activating factor acetylhydrolase